MRVLLTVQQTESTARAYEALLVKQREIQAQLANFDPETKRSVEDGWRHGEAISQMIASSEPASPPEYASAFPTPFSRPARYSAASLTSPPQGILNRPNRSSTQLTSPPGGFVRPYTSGNTHIPSQSVPGSRRHSDDEEEDDFIYGFENHHRAAAK